MLKTFRSLNVVEFEDTKFTKKLDKEMGIILRAAVKVWLRTVLTTITGAPFTIGDSFPIQTGAAKGSLKPLGRLLRVSVPVRPAPRRKNRISEGEASSRFVLIDDKLRPLSYMYRFEWATELPHFITNEFYHVDFVKSGTPWGVTRAANIAASAFIRDEVKKRLKQYKIRQFVKVTNG